MQSLLNPLCRTMANRMSTIITKQNPIINGRKYSQKKDIEKFKEDVKDGAFVLYTCAIAGGALYGAGHGIQKGLKMAVREAKSRNEAILLSLMLGVWGGVIGGVVGGVTTAVFPLSLYVTYKWNTKHHDMVSQQGGKPGEKEFEDEDLNSMSSRK